MPMKMSPLSLATVLLCLICALAHASGATPLVGGEIRLLVRADDAGSFHSANQACIDCATKGIVRSVEVMAPGPWFAEAVKLLRQNPQIDVGIHLVLTSEWESCKWGPVSAVPTLVDSNGRFFPMVWRNSNFPPRTSIQESAWQVSDVEKELRAQIEIALRNLPRITHLSGHMAFESLDPRLAQLVERLRREYRLQPGSPERGLTLFPGWGQEKSTEGRIQAFVANVEKMTPGNYLFVDHPGMKCPEMDSIGHKGYENVSADREAVTRVFTSPAVMDALRQKGVKLISYGDLARK